MSPPVCDLRRSVTTDPYQQVRSNYGREWAAAAETQCSVAHGDGPIEIARELRAESRYLRMVTRVLLQRSQAVRAEAKAARETAEAATAAVRAQNAEVEAMTRATSFVTRLRLAAAKFKDYETPTTLP